MSNVIVPCPTCGQKYSVDRDYLGCLITCKVESCGATFVAEDPSSKPELETSQTVAVSTAKVDRILGNKPYKPIDAAGIAGRLTFFAGAACIIVAMVFTSTIPSTDGKRIHNQPRAASRQLLMLAGIALTVSGSTIWSRSPNPMRVSEAACVGLFVMAVLIAGFRDLAKEAPDEQIERRDRSAPLF